MLELRRPQKTQPSGVRPVREELRQYVGAVCNPAVGRFQFAQQDYVRAGVIAGDQAGIKYQGNGSSAIAYASLSRPAVLDPAADGLVSTHVFVFSSVNGTSNDTIAGLGATTGGAGNTLFRLIGATAGVTFQVQQSNGGVLYNTASSNFGANDNRPHVVIVRAPVTSTFPESLTYFADGRNVGTVARSTGFSVSTTFGLANVNGTRRGGSSLGFGNWNVYLYVPLLGVGMPDDWCARASQSPAHAFDAIFEPRRIWVPVSAGGPAYTLDLLAGSYTTTGNSATLSASRRLDLNAGSYSLLGNQVTLTLAKTLTLDAGSYSLTGQSAQLTVSRRLDLNAGSYSVTGNSAELTYTSGAPTYTLDLLAGSYSLTGNSVNLFASRNLTLGRGNYTITGRSATLTYSNAAPVLPPVRPWYYIPGPIPTTAESWLVRELQTISQATYGAAPYIQMEPRAVEPDKPREGMLAFADGVNWNPGSGAGVYVRASGAWVKL